MKLFSSARSVHTLFFSGALREEQNLGPDGEQKIDSLAALESASSVLPKTKFAFWISLFRGCAYELRTMIVGSLIVAALNVVLLLVAHQFMESLGDFASGLVLAIAYAAIQFSSAFLDFQQGQRRARFMLAAQTQQILWVNQKVLRLYPGPERQEFSSGMLKSLVHSDVESIDEFVWFCCQNILPGIASIIFLAPILYYFMGWIGIVGILVTTLQFPLSSLLAKLFEKTRTRVQSRRDLLSTRLFEWLRNMRLVRCLGWQRAMQQQINKDMYNFSKVDLIQGLLENILYGLSLAWWMITVFVMYLLARHTGKPFETASFFSAVLAINSVDNYIRYFPTVIAQYGSATASVNRFLQLFRARELDQAFSKSSPILPIGRARKIILNNLKLGYGNLVILNIPELTLDLTEVTVVVGEVASGKSTLLRALSGELVPLEGRILIEDERGTLNNLWQKEVHSWWRAQIGIVQQLPFLSNALLKTNISLSLESNNESLNKVTGATCLETDIAQLPAGLLTEVGEIGVNLSGGQKARVELARALYSERKILFLEDPLSAVDVTTENILAKSIINGGFGGILVSHRFGTLHQFPRVLVLASGTIVEDNTPSLLLAKADSLYARLATSFSGRESL